MSLIEGKEKAWTAFVIGTVVQSLNIVINSLPDTQPKMTLTIICTIIGTIGQGLGVYQIANTGYVKVDPQPPLKIVNSEGENVWTWDANQGKYVLKASA